MQQVKTVNAPAVLTAAAPTPGVRDFMRHWLSGRRGFIVGGLVLIAAGLALGWNWLSAIGVAPIILSLAPCAAMCALGTCAMMKGKSSGVKPSSPDQATTLESAPTPTQSGGPEL